MIDVVIVNWNSGPQLADAVKSVIQFGDDLVSDIIVVDNGSEDESDKIASNFEWVKLIRTGLNNGFGRACNLGAKHGDAEFLLFLNPDAALQEQTLKNAIACIGSPRSSDVGICGVQLVDQAGLVSRSCSRFPTVWSFAARAVGIDRWLASTGYLMTDWDHASTRDVDHVIGAFYLVRRSLFEQLNGFDERFFVYLEDLDFSRRAKLAGWRSVYLADVQAFHAGGGTSHQAKARRLFYSLRSRILYAAKHFSAIGAGWVALVTLVVEPLCRSTFAAARLSWSGLSETWGGYRLLWTWLPRWLLRGETR